jgi:hypothetical protein
MKSPGKTTLFRMQRTAQLEAERIEIGQDARVLAGMLKVPMPEQVERRDDFAGIVRLIDIIMSDQLLLQRLQERMAARAQPILAAQSAGDDVAIDAETEAP